MNRIILLLSILLIFIPCTGCSFSRKVMSDIRCGYVDASTGKAITSIQFRACFPYSEGLAAVLTLGHPSKAGYINLNGQYIIKPQYLAAGQFSEGLAAVKTKDSLLYIDKSGQPAFKLSNSEYDMRHSGGLFSEGLARIASKPRQGLHDNWVKYGFINRSGELVIKPKYHYASDFKYGRAIVVDGPEQSQGKIIDKSGNIIYSAKKGQHLSSQGYSDGLLAFCEQGQQKFLDVNGNILLVLRASCNNSPFSEGLAPIKENGKWGFINKQGQFVIRPQFVWVGSFSGGLTGACLNYKKCRAIDKQGHFIFKSHDYGFISVFQNGIAPFRRSIPFLPPYVFGNHQWGLIDKGEKLRLELTGALI